MRRFLGRLLAGQDPQDGDKQIIPPLTSSLKTNLSTLHTLFSECADLRVREFQIAVRGGVPAAIAFLDNMTDEAKLQTAVLAPLMERSPAPEFPTRGSFIFNLQEKLLLAGETKLINTWSQIELALFSGAAVLFTQGSKTSLAIFLEGWPERPVTEPAAEAQIRGPREGFTESLGTNISLLRRRIKTHDFKVELFRLGRRTQTEVALVYLQGVVDPALVDEARSRLSRIDVDAILESNYIEELIEDEPLSLFPMMENTERPDKAAAAVLEGKIVILTDTTPFALIAPTTIWDFFHASEDYYEPYIIMSLLRLLRLVAANISLILPAFYIAISAYHQEALPLPLLQSFATMREIAPFPTALEMITMDFLFELIREAGLRLPRYVGQAISIVGALVIGEAAVRATLISPVTVIVVALTAVASFSLPAYSQANTLRALRFVLMILASFLGLLGMAFGLFVLQIHLNTLRSFGVPYLTPVAPFIPSAMRDAAVRYPMWAMRKRPSFLRIRDRYRQARGLKPGPD